MAFLSDIAIKGKLLSDAVSLIKKFSGEVVVVQYSGSSLSDPTKLSAFAQDIVLLKSCGIDVIIVHGSGPNLEQKLKILGTQIKQTEGIEISQKDNTSLIEMFLSGYINKQLVFEICKAGGLALGFSGKDASMVTAKKLCKTAKQTGSNIERILDFGNAGTPEKINADIFQIIGESPIIPVISPVGFDENHNTYILNADEVAASIATSLSANRLILMSDDGGLKDNDGEIFNTLSLAEAENLAKYNIADKAKLTFCLKVLYGNVFAVHIINAQEDHSILLELLTKERTGTLIYRDEPNISLEEDCPEKH